MHRSQVNNAVRETEAAFDQRLNVRVDWAPAYELVAGFVTFALHKKHEVHELGPGWFERVRRQLPAHFPAHSVLKPKYDDDLLIRLVSACPGDRTPQAWLDWFAQLHPGAAYEALHPITPDDTPPLPRDFLNWRDRMVDVLRVWNDSYFAALDPDVLTRIEREARALRRRVRTARPRELVEEVANGIWLDPAPNLSDVVLVPQYHLRPYIHLCGLASGLIVLYPADSTASPTDGPPLGLLRLTRALADDSRLRILRFLSGTDGPCSLTEIARFAGLSQPTVHHHLAQLRAAGLVRVHFSVSTSPSRYSLRPQTVEQLTHQLGAYLETDSASKGDRGA